MSNGMHHTRNGMAEKTRIEIAAMLNKTVANLINLYMQTKQAHWNIKGNDFIAVHKLLDEIAEQVEEHIDIAAERITALGGTAYATLETVSKATQLRVYPTDITSVVSHIEHLTHNFAILGELTRADINASDELGDYGTNDLYIGIVRMLDHNLWLLEAHIQK